MAKVFGFKEILYNEDKTIYVETAYEIFQQCFLKADIGDNKNRPVRMADALTCEFIDNPVDASYVKNTYRAIKNLRAENVQYKTITLSYKYILAFAEYAGIKDLMAYNQKYGPSFSIPVLFSPRTFRLFNFIRVPKQGRVKKIDTGWEYIGDNKEHIEGAVQGVNIFTMPGDRNPLWVHVKYYHQNILYDGYFAENTSPSIKPITELNRLLLFFKKMQPDGKV